MAKHKIQQEAISMTVRFTVENVFQEADQMLRKQLFNELLARAISVEEKDYEVLHQVEKSA